jgi:hypothetical protein
MSRRRVARVAALLLLVLAARVGVAGAAQTTTQPSPATARTFATSDGGWSSKVGHDGLVCVAGVTCAAADPSYEATGGADGADDGFLRSSFGTVLGLLSSTTIGWTSPSFAAPAETDQATLSLAIRPQVASLLAIGSVTVTVRLLDVADGSRTTTIGTIPLTAASSSFSTATVAVPASALVPGRTYALEVDTTLTTTVSAVTSGNVDVDDVTLTMTDLQPPRGLSAGVPSTGAARVTGSVDPRGQATTLTVHYGSTSAYDRSTSAVTVSGSGAQPFTIPFAGLVPGQLYHYAVTATNADGTVTTGDQAFTAPTAPSDAPPTVSGAGNSRLRTVAFDRAANVVNAVVEVLDGSNAVVATAQDLAGDGTVAVTLPDADGTYAVRVVRTDDRGQTTTSTTVPAVLDRVPPSLVGVALTVTPTVAAGAQRSVAFARPADAVAAQLQVVDSDGTAVGAPLLVAGGSATVQLGTVDGSYAVRLTLTDAAGNSAAVVSAPVTLDGSAPSAGGAPAVVGAGNSRDRTVTFERDPATVNATVEVLDSAGDVVDSVPAPLGNTATVTLPDADGGYTVRVRQADLAGNVATSAGTAVTLDRVAPDAGAAPTVAGAESSRTRSVSFTRAPDAVGATVELLGDGVALASIDVPSGNGATVTLPDLDGEYAVRVTQADGAGNSATSAAATVTLDRRPPLAGDAPTVTGDPDALHVTFRRAADAALATVQVFDSRGWLVQSTPLATGAATTIALPSTAGTYFIRVRQTDAAGNSATTPSTSVMRPTDRGGDDRSGESGDGGGGTGDDAAGDGGAGGAGNGGGAAGGGDGGMAGAASGAGAGGTGTFTAKSAEGPNALTDPGAFGAVLKQCFGGAGDVVVTDVLLQGAKVTVRGITRFAPRTVVTIVDRAGRTAATASTSARGSFAVVLKRAPRTRRQLLAEGYRAVVGSARSQLVRVRRANVLTSLTVSGGILTVKGRVDLARMGRLKSVRVYGGAGAAGCTRQAALKHVGRGRINRRTGAYQVRVRAPTGSGKLVVRTRAYGTRLTSRSAFAVR